MENIFKDPSIRNRVILENIFVHLEFEDIVASTLINKWCFEVLNESSFWIKKWSKNGLMTTHKEEWINILALAKNTNQERYVIRYIKRVIQKGHYISAPCYIDNIVLARFSNFLVDPMPQVEASIRYFINEYFLEDNIKMGYLQLLAPSIKNYNAVIGQPLPRILSDSLDAAQEVLNESSFWIKKWSIIKILAPIMDNPNAPDFNSWDYHYDHEGLDESTPIKWAACGGNLEMIKYFTSFIETPKSQKNIQSVNDGINEAAFRGHLDIIKHLTKFTDNPNAPDKAIGRTPISGAAYRGHQDIVEYLAPLCDNHNASDWSGRTPMDYAVQEGHQGIVDILTQYVGTQEQGSTGLFDKIKKFFGLN